MQATDVAPSRLDEAKRQVGELIDQMRSGDVAMLISFADTARVEQGFTDDRRQLHRALEAIRPTSRGTSLLEALKLAAGLANPGRSAEDVSDVQVAEALPATLYIFSDGRFGPVAGFALGNLDPKFVPIGSPEARNVGITAFSVRRNETEARPAPGVRPAGELRPRAGQRVAGAVPRRPADRRRPGRGVARGEPRGGLRSGGGRVAAC